MSFANLSLLAVGAGIVGLAAVLYLLQRLRVRYREIPVVTTLFWREAVEQAPVRVFRKRFRHLFAYLLILAICSLIWISFADPRLENRSAGQENYVLLLDGSAGMARSGRFERVVAALREDVARLPDNAREVLWVGATVKKLLAFGEHPLLLDERLQHLAPEAAPSSVENQLRQLAAVSREGRATTVLIYGDAPVRQEILDSLPSWVKVVRAESSEVEVGNAGISVLGIGEAISGAWNKVDLIVGIQDDEDRVITRDDFTIEIDGQALEVSAIEETKPGTFFVRDVPAEGGLLQVRLDRDDVLSLDNVARLRLPHRLPIKVLLSPSLVEVLGGLLSFDRAVELTDQNPDVIVRRQGEDVGTEPFNAAKPVLEFVPMKSQSVAFSLIYGDGQKTPPSLAEVMSSIGLNQIDASTLAETARQPIGVSMQAGPVWNFSVWEELIGSEFNFVQSRSFPLFIAKSLRWLSGVKTWYPYIAAGQPLVAASDGRQYIFADQKGDILETLGAEFVPARAGTLLDASGRQAPGSDDLSVSLLDSPVTLGVTGVTLDVFDASLATVFKSQNLVTWLLMLALSLLAIEWFFYQKGLLP